MGGFERKVGGSTLVQQQSADARGIAPGKQTLSGQLHAGSAPSPAPKSSAPLTDAESADLLPEQDEADAMEEGMLASFASSSNGAPLEPSLALHDGTPLANHASAARTHDAAELQEHDRARPEAPTSNKAEGARYVRAISFVAPGVLGPMIREQDGWLLQTAPDPSAGYNFDTYLYDAGRGARIPAKALGGTRYQVMMGTTECPGCHFGHGLEVDLYGQNFMEIVGMLAAGGAGVLGGGEPIPMEGEAPMAATSEPVPSRPAGPPNLRVIEGGGGAPIVPRSSPMSTGGPRYAMAGNAALQTEPAMLGALQAAEAPHAQLSLVPEAAPMPEAAAVPQARKPSAQSGPRLSAVSASTGKHSAGKTKSEDICPPGSHPIKWPFPIWTSLGYGDSGAMDADNNHPGTPTLTRIYKPKRNPQYRKTYLTRNAVALRSVYQRGIRGAIHHKIPLYVSGVDSVDNLVFLPSSQHSQWHNQLARQGTTGWMPFDPGGTVYCVL